MELVLQAQRSVLLTVKIINSRGLRTEPCGVPVNCLVCAVKTVLKTFKIYQVPDLFVTLQNFIDTLVTVF